MEKFSVSVEVVHKNPDIILYRNLLSKKECEHIIKKSEKYMSRSKTFSSGNDPRRTSSTAFTNHNEFFNDPVMNSVKERCAALSGFPPCHIEVPQVVRYFPGEKFVTHSDAYDTSSHSYKVSGQRDYTFFIYLNEPSDNSDTAGGETSFPTIPIPKTKWEEKKYRSPVKVKPERGMGAFWRNIGTDTKKVTNITWHEGLPPKGWTKWGMNVWIRNKPYAG